MTRYARIFVAACALALAAGPALADFQGHGPQGANGLMSMMMLLHHADLTPAQQTKIDQIMKSSFGEAHPLMKQLRTVHEQIAARLLGPGNMQASDFASLQKQENALRSQLDTQMLAAALKVRAVLTPAQLAKLAKLHSQLEALHAQAQALLGEDEPPAPPAQ